ncbi:hypothetical protein Pmar_PMAR008943 [Perkinsus marinus ATCC 50983]|uniref:Uncharacterized protein n=1 Tax=Perkinsus marinus (strain ATCC 50983 / TXsc) TaxID=423536 RepID=C5LTG0_PERM5|nr:hypothetical protein Pmar_PMAR008943 [Perkinsus marinus ATCC 50983]EEQ99981.1 hypothetical protein Pmar_PMAR008943 [Perkinsus marinus ATCC 50983]|eukprot:XP_002767264.1 hypothetical protein Pmar_PMAR008943 [Perkinsus marinus ATCC 50983]
MMLFWVVKDCGDYNRVKELAQGSVRNMRPLTDPLTIFDVNALRPGRMGSAEDVQLRIILWRAVAFAVSNDEDCAKEGENYEGAVGLRKVFAEADGVNIVLRYVQRLVGERHSRSGSVDTQQHYAKLFSKSLNTLMLGLEFCKASVTEENTELSTAAVPILCGIIAMDGDTEMRHGENLLF